MKETGQQSIHVSWSSFAVAAKERNYTNLNHGSYGATPLPVLQAERKWQDVMERNPDQWFRFDGSALI